MTESEENAWAAGVLDAKGYANHRRREGTKGWRYVLRITDTNEELLRRFARVVGHGVIRGPLNGGPLALRPQYRWETSSHDSICAVLDLLAPYAASETIERLTPR